MQKLPKAIIKKYGISKKAWAVFRGKRGKSTKKGVSMTKKTYKKSYKKKYKKYSSTASWFPLGLTHLGRLRYVENISIDPGAGVLGSYTYSANSLYDPNVSSTGHQTYYFDEFMNLYNKYVVLGSKITIRLCTVGATSPNMWFSVKLSDQTTLNTGSTQNALEQPGFGKKYYITNGSQSVPVATTKFSAKKFFGLTKATVNSNYDLEGTNASSPLDQAYFIVCLGPLIAGENLPAYNIQVTIDYFARFTGPRETTPS